MQKEKHYQLYVYKKKTNQLLKSKIAIVVTKSWMK